MTDVIDQATEHIEKEQAAALRAHHARVEASFVARDPAVEGLCIDCGEVIEAARLRVLRKTSRCADCAHIFEQRQERPAWATR